MKEHERIAGELKGFANRIEGRIDGVGSAL